MFHYKFSYYLERPDYLWYDLTNPIKWAWQRVFRGWDNRAVWSIDAYLAELIPQLLRKLKVDSHGIPAGMFDQPLDEITPEAEAVALAKWNAILDEMIAGFEAADRYLNVNYRESELPEIKRLFDCGMDLLKEYFFDLWD